MTKNKDNKQMPFISLEGSSITKKEFIAFLKAKNYRYIKRYGKPNPRIQINNKPATMKDVPPTNANYTHTFAGTIKKGTKLEIITKAVNGFIAVELPNNGPILQIPTHLLD